MICLRVKTDKDIRDFVSLPDKLYKHKFKTQSKKTEREVLTESHVLSSNFKIYAYIVKDKHTVVSRAILTVYENDSNGYIGYFESFNNLRAVNLLIQEIKKKAKELGKDKLVGPVDCSFWIKYRFKVDHFDNIYTGEPYNLDYYEQLWKDCGFAVSERYYSNQLRVPTKLDTNNKCKSRLEFCKNKGYQIRTTSKTEYQSDFENIYQLLSKLYSNFPLYKHIDKDKFLKMFHYMRFILDYRMVYVAYKNNKLSGFMVCIPNYNKGSIIKHLLGIHSEYVMMYLGVDNGHYGLGGAFSELCKEFLETHGCTCIPALIHEGNKSGVFYKELAVDKYNYVLMEKQLDNSLE